jgi:hypothetical protein
MEDFAGFIVNLRAVPRAATLVVFSVCGTMTTGVGKVNIYEKDIELDNSFLRYFLPALTI